MKPRSFTFSVECALDAHEAWRRVADVSEHGRVVPFTRGAGPSPDDLQVGSRLVARTAIGPIGFDDVMVVRAMEPGRVLVLEKVGAFIGGVVDVRFAPRSSPPVATWLEWRQSIEVPWLRGRLSVLGRTAAVLAVPVVRRGYRHTVEKLLDVGEA